MSIQSLELNAEFKEAVVEILFQLADDDFLYSYRNSEWLGLVPHIEEDVASSSITQDSMGHAAMFYELLEELGYGKADDLAHGRSASDRKNCILVERVNGPGYYMENPQYDWAYAVVRNYFYTMAKKMKMDALKQCSYAPLAEIAVKVNMEIYYHLMHWKTWFVQLLSSTEEAKERMNNAIEKVLNDFGDVFSFGEKEDKMKQLGLIDAEALKQDWLLAINKTFATVGLDPIEDIKQQGINGRNGVHTAELDDAIATLSEVYGSDPTTAW